MMFSRLGRSIPLTGHPAFHGYAQAGRAAVLGFSASLHTQSGRGAICLYEINPLAAACHRGPAGIPAFLQCGAVRVEGEEAVQ